MELDTDLLHNKLTTKNNAFYDAVGIQTLNKRDNLCKEIKKLNVISSTH